MTDSSIDLGEHSFKGLGSKWETIIQPDASKWIRLYFDKDGISGFLDVKMKGLVQAIQRDAPELLR